MKFFDKQKKYFIWWPLLGTVIILVAFVSYVFFTQPTPREDMTFGVTYSLTYIDDLELDYKEVYDAILDDLRVEYIRLPIYWNITEPELGNYNFEEYDYLIRKAEEKGVYLTAVVGRRQPRWPECHSPIWAQRFSESTQQRTILRNIETIVKRYKDSPAIIAWQVDNEPMFRIFGVCPEPDYNFLVEEVELVRSLDPSRPIQITDSGELSTWLETSYLADQLGISMYRITWNRHFGYWYYPLGPNFYIRHAQAVAPLVDRVIISELQAEPWFPDRPVAEVPLSEQYKSMNTEIFKNNIHFARRTQFDEAYLWGVEWWYWLKKQHNETAMWDSARALFSGEL